MRDPNFQYLLLIIAMALVSFALRAVPAVFISKLKLNPWLERFFNMLPITVMISLIFPAIFYAIEGELWINITVALVSIVIAFINLHFAINIVLAVVLAFLLLLI